MEGLATQDFDKKTERHGMYVPLGRAALDLARGLAGVGLARLLAGKGNGSDADWTLMLCQAR